ncbi:MAG: copper(I)-binding protein [Arcobacteraceae bacterium]|jgi:copper(I)-binding protein
MKRLIVLALLSVSTLFASNIEVKDAYVRATPPGLPNSAAFMTVVNHTSEDIAIVKASSTIAKAVELHTHDMKNGVMKMYQVPKIVVPKNAETILQPGGFHVMLIGLVKPLKNKEMVTFTLEFSNGETKTITAPIKTVMAGMKHTNMNHNKMNHSN